MEEQNIVATYVKAPVFKNAEIALVSSCLKAVSPRIWEELKKKYVVFVFCPELHGQTALYGKLASIIRSTHPKKIVVVTVEGSPHCFTMHAAVNEAMYILGESIPHEHYVVLNDKMIRISREAIRVARYLHIVDKLIKEKPEILKELFKYSLEYKKALETDDAEIKT